MSTKTIEHKPLVLETIFNLDNAPASIRLAITAMSPEELQDFLTLASINLIGQFLQTANENNSYAVLQIKSDVPTERR